MSTYYGSFSDFVNQNSDKNVINRIILNLFIVLNLNFQNIFKLNDALNTVNNTINGYKAGNLQFFKQTLLF